MVIHSSGKLRNQRNKYWVLRGVLSKDIALYKDGIGVKKQRGQDPAQQDRPPSPYPKDQGKKAVAGTQRQRRLPEQL